MTAVYPTTVKGFTTRIDYVDNVLAVHVNDLQDEVNAIEGIIGNQPHISSGWAGAFDQVTTTWTNVKSRISNIEYGITSILPRVLPTGGTAGQVLNKNSGTNYDVGWITAPILAAMYRYRFTATGGETSKSGLDDNAATLSYVVGLDETFLNGVLLVCGVDYVASTGTSITGLAPLVASDVLEVITYSSFSIAGAIPESVVTAKGDLLVATSSGVVSRLPIGSGGTAGTIAQGLRADSTASAGMSWTDDASILQVMQAI